jgi:hypothetical protein
MRKTLMAALAVVLMAVAVPATAAVAAPDPPSQACYGQVIAGIASTWPWAHDDRVDFAPPPGAIALWIEIFGPFVGVSSVRELQIQFCTE